MSLSKMDVPDQPNSICHIQSIHMYPLPSRDVQKQLPFALLTGETVVHSGSSVDGMIVVTNYRLFLQNQESHYHIPVGLIEVVEIREMFYLQIGCKDARTYRCTFENNENALEWYDRIQKASDPPRQLEQLFAFYYCVWAKERGGEEVILKLQNQRKYIFDKKMFENEMTRLQFQGHSWRISKANENYKLCPTYPPYLLVPSCINDEMLESVAKFRSSRRIPAAVWRHTTNGAIIARCSQPEVGWLGWRSSEDEDLLKAISEACNFDRSLKTTNGHYDKDFNLSNSPGSLHSDESLQITGEVNHTQKKVLIMDARSYTTAVANRARGGGCECPEYYPNCEIQFMNLANIHSIRKSFHALRQLCTSSAEQPNWFSQLEGTRWLLHMSGLIKAAVTLATAVERDARPVVVHCSDGWDRTPQIVALAEVLLDPYYRTVEGFRVLIEREWLAFGHKFADRCGHSTGSDDQNERCPVFLQWLDCVHQLLVQYPCSFEFSQNYLIKLVQHTYSNLFGTFLCNTQKQRVKVVYGKTFSIWELLDAPSYRNHLYAPVGISNSGKVMWPKTHVRDLVLWSEVYLGSLEANFSSEGALGSCPGPPNTLVHPNNNMAKTRSYGDLVNADVTCQNLYNGRRSSDPNINRDANLNALTSEFSQEFNHGRLDSVNSGPDFLPSDLEDTVDCNQDCIFKEHAPTSNLTDDQIDGLAQSDFVPPTHNGTSSTLVEDPPLFETPARNMVGASAFSGPDHPTFGGASTLSGQAPPTLVEPIPSFGQDPATLVWTPALFDNVPPTSARAPALFDNAPPASIGASTLFDQAPPISSCIAPSEETDSATDLGDFGEEPVYFLPKQLSSDDDTDSSEVVIKCNGNHSDENKTDDNSDAVVKFFKNSNNNIDCSVGGGSERKLVICETSDDDDDEVVLRRVVGGNVVGEDCSEGGGACEDEIVGKVLDLERSVETSTETLVSENVICGSSPKEYNGFEKIRHPVENGLHSVEGCAACAESTKNIPNGTHSNNNIRTHRYSHYSNVSNNSSNGWDNTLHHYTHHGNYFHQYQYPLGEDGLVPLRSPVQERLDQLLEDHKRKVDLLEKELHASRQILIKQACHRCTPLDNDKQDDNSDSDTSSPYTRRSKSCSRHKRILRTSLSSVVGSVCSASEGHASAGESLRSDVSWVAVEEGALVECQGTLWVPDHAVSRCTGCGTEFWMGRRRHHCRKCGRIFCADCSENSTPLPAEQLYNPVRVCTGCYTELRRDCGEIPIMISQCKQHHNGNVANGTAGNSNPRIAASSN